MPKSRRGEKRPDELIAAAGKSMPILTDSKAAPVDDGKDPHAKALGAKGGAARAKSLSAARKTEIAKTAAAKRWKKN